MCKPLLATACAALLLAACGDRTQAVVAASSPDTPLPARDFMLFFGNDRANVTPESEGVILEAARAARANPNAHITVSGNADTFGDKAYNQALSQKRAEAVRDALVADGINPATISVVGYGERPCRFQPRTVCVSRRTGAPRSSCSRERERGFGQIAATQPSPLEWGGSAALPRHVADAVRHVGDVSVLQVVRQPACEAECETQPEQAGDESSGNRSHVPKNRSDAAQIPASDVQK